jgi:hypothetical protein
MLTTFMVQCEHLITESIAQAERTPYTWSEMSASSTSFVARTTIENSRYESKSINPLTVSVTSPPAVCLDGIYGGDGKRQWNSERHVIDHRYAHFKRAGVETNGILEPKFLSETEHRTF